MKKLAPALLISVLILALFDGIATFIEISRGLAVELHPILYSFQNLIGLKNWLYFHIFFWLVAGVVFTIGICKKIYWPVYLFFIIEIIVAWLHISGLMTLFP